MCRNFGTIPSDKVEIFKQGTCSGYVIATFEMQVETLQFQRKDRTIRNRALKPGPLPGLHSSTEQLVAIVNNYLNAHPERWNEGASVLVQDSLYDAFWKGKTVLTAK
jgi:hypothetical protein